MSAHQIMAGEAFQRCAQFHGHVCPGLSIGYRMTLAAMQKLAAARAEDEELVAVVETNACSADAVQVLTGCTFGKGNFFFKDHGKMALTLFSRSNGRGVRVAMRSNVFDPQDEHSRLLRKVMQNQADTGEKERFNALHQQRSHEILEMDIDQLFDISAVEAPIPQRAAMEPSESCARCGEPTMRTKLREIDGARLCCACADSAIA